MYMNLYNLPYDEEGKCELCVVRTKTKKQRGNETIQYYNLMNA
jgi:hypothetical protein